MDRIRESELTGLDGKRAQTLIATMTPTSPDAHGHTYGLVAQTLIGRVIMPKTTTLYDPKPER